MKVMRKIIEIDDELCDGCGQCVPSCAEGAIEVVDGKVRLVADKYCDGLGACMGECPKGALKIVEREAEDFDEEAVEQYLNQKADTVEAMPMASACPSSQIQTFAPAHSSGETGEDSGRTGPSLSHWPVQINLIPANAPFLRGADLLVAADCVPVACPDFHRNFVKGKVVMIGCPKFDDVESYIEKLTEIFRTADIRSVTALVMEVPCCSALPVILEKAMHAAGRSIPLEQVVIGPRGHILKREVRKASQ